MSSTDNTLNVSPERLAAGAATAGATETASVPAPLVPPPPGGTSLLDIAAGAAANAIVAMIAKADAADAAAAGTQTASLTESPPTVVQQDQQAAGDYQRSVTFPIPAVTPLAPGTGQVFTV
ncbi:hypothetical protein OEM_p200110 (plasmid) [Mycobacterium intracellulare subsp. yongonense 05-1390]|uniref:PE domain-containing protein n=1 Tax=Mycobacterium sp. MOTT-90 TaxID=1069227 RepID=A0A1L1V8G9_9MYCO|nr:MULTISPECIES: hypothetical protein [Mycobacterium]AFQ68250.1 hypothetical protein [Mycobacterium sp. MOTT-90]AFV14934.1 hypothetical protein OEM_p200110 [Mycobacterium intracellulare subsp. yongonense 05-1390]